MAVSDHIKIASAELRKAAELVKQEIESLRNEETQKRTELRNRISTLLLTLRSRENDLHRVDDPNLKTQIQHDMRTIEREIAQRRVEENEIQRQLENVISAKEGQVMRLESQSRGLSS